MCLKMVFVLVRIIGDKMILKSFFIAKINISLF